MIKKKHGFTLVEIMIVVAIIAAMAALAVPNLLRARITTNESSAQTTLKTISNALENYASINSQYPPNTAALIGPDPPYLNRDFFAASYNGYNFTVTDLQAYSYTITAAPVSASTGTRSFTVATGGVLTAL